MHKNTFLFKSQGYLYLKIFFVTLFYFFFSSLLSSFFYSLKLSFIFFPFLDFSFAVLFRAVDETLCRVSASKLALRALSPPQNTPAQTLKSVSLKKSDGDLESRGLDPSVSVGVGSPLPRKKSRLRGGSFGQQVRS